jgi:hypothetical protein
MNVWHSLGWVVKRIELQSGPQRIMGSEQEFDKGSILRGLPEHDEFGFGDGHALSLEEQVA